MPFKPNFLEYNGKLYVRARSHRQVVMQALKEIIENPLADPGVRYKAICDLEDCKNNIKWPNRMFRVKAKVGRPKKAVEKVKKSKKGSVNRVAYYVTNLVMKAHTEGKEYHEVSPDGDSPSGISSLVGIY